MKEQDWDDSIDAPKQLLDAAALLAEEEDSEIKAKPNSQKAQVTELRRRLEERLESKRISLEFDYEDLDNWTDSIQ